jgi:prevent-host-death family protein
MTYTPRHEHRAGYATISQARRELADIVNRVAYGGQRIRLMRHGRAIAAIVPVEDLALLDRVDGADRRTPGELQADADRSDIRRLVAMSDREREAFFLTSNRNVLRMFAAARPSG